MATQAEVEAVFVNAGKQLKADLWRPDDLKLIASRAKDLVGLDAKAKAAQDPALKRQYQLAAEGVVEHVKLLALLRMQVAQDHLLDALGRFFMNIVIPALGKLIKSVIPGL